MGDSRTGTLERVEHSVIPRIAYGAAFTVLLPIALICWAYATRNLITATPVRALVLGLGIVAAGFVCLATGMAVLWFKGGGLPMNAFPPSRFVADGIYAIFPHPIYAGFTLTCAGISLAVGSASGLWLVTPTVALGCVALVLGYELPDLKTRFGSKACLLVLPPADKVSPSLSERARCFFTVLLPWLLVYEAIFRLGIPHDARSTYLPFELGGPVWPMAEALYASVYIVVCLTPVLLRSRADLRWFSVHAFVAMVIVFPLYLVLPLVGEPRPFVASGFWGHILQYERTVQSGAASFPSFHVVWALIAAEALGHRNKVHSTFAHTWAVLALLSCWLTGMHSLADIAAGIAVFVAVLRSESLWHKVLQYTESIANSWKEWHFGLVRVINHGIYAGMATLIGFWLIDSLLGPGHTLVTLSVFLSGVVGAALWAQWVEGSPSLLRPLGFYGGMIGMMAGAAVGLAQGISIWTVWAALCIAAPWIQGIGRIRCLVQGCCHGRPVETVPGIRYNHPRSRVCRLSAFTGIPIHATPLYSILWNGFVALALIRLLTLGVRTTTLCGIYLLLLGLGRFVEEAYRGEPQTLVVLGLRLYQWLAVLCVLGGAVVLAIERAPIVPRLVLHSSSITVAIGCGIAAWFVSGVDFPQSNHRFARLT